MTAAELMQPRYEVIADYPGNQALIGQILECPKFDNEFTVEYWKKMHSIYPHLFRKLNWWEYRNAEDMPKKVKDGDGRIFDVAHWDMERLIVYLGDEMLMQMPLVYCEESRYFPVD